MLHKLTVIDDSYEDYLTIKRFLKKSFDNIEIHYFDSGNAALQSDILQKSDCILLDYLLPDIDGIEVLKQLSSSSSIPTVIMVTGEGNEKIAVTALKLGALDYLVKDSLSEAALTRAIINAFEKAKLKRKIKEQDEALKKAAFTDYLTALPNRHAFEKEGEKILNNAFEKSTRLSLLMIDIDNFKMINDTLGHLAGDMVLKELSRRYTSLLSSRGFFARLGGDEFAALLTGKENNEVITIAEDLLTAMQTPIDLVKEARSISVSIGIAFAREGDDLDHLLQRADKAMYKAKEKGKANYQLYIGLDNKEI
ncbi:GGDEF domain-containing response regulator [Fangia hongkongensis]|uniref:GGDEF domain-containing response regulator n=1 Tax=Fangia hongkongensis TaxID=270495 RepID=UPI00035D48AC|nr:GGDEF domain-containing response regulator [Fangia hongkongensis]MBK2124534.1 GGDEF domain-containing response regulator [Fangia hongkongensis]